MELAAAAATIGQTAGYALSLISSLQNLHDAMKNGRRLFQDEYLSTGHLLNILKENKYTHTCYLQHLLLSIEESAQRLALLFKKDGRAQVALILLLRRKEIDEAFASLERKKSVLILYFTVEITNTITEIQGKTMDNSSKHAHKHSPSIDSNTTNQTSNFSQASSSQITSNDEDKELVQVVDNLKQKSSDHSSSAKTPKSGHVPQTFRAENNYASGSKQYLYNSETLPVIHQGNKAIFSENLPHSSSDPPPPPVSNPSSMGPTMEYHNNYCLNSVQRISGSGDSSIWAAANIATANSNQQIGMTPGHNGKHKKKDEKKNKKGVVQELGNIHK